MNILLTGGTGLVGTDILNLLSQDDHRIYCVSRTEPKLLSENITWTPLDFSDESAQIHDLPDVDALIHAGAHINSGITDDQLTLLRKVNIEFTENLFRHYMNEKCPTIIHISTFNFLKKPLQRPVTEDHPVGAESPYGLSKLWGEFSLFNSSNESKTKRVSLRISSPLPTDYKLMRDTVIKKWVDLARKGNAITVFGSGQRTQDFVQTKDIAMAVKQSLDTDDVEGIFNIASGVPISMIDAARLISEELEVDINQSGTDPNEGEMMDISIEKARTQLKYSPRFTATQAIESLLKNLDP